MDSKILLVSTCQHRLHEDEFVVPVKDVLEKLNFDYNIINYKKIGSFSKSLNFKNYSKIIICGTALKDFDYMNYIDDFFWMQDMNEKSILGICSGSQIIGGVFGSTLKDGFEVGSIKIEVVQDDDILKGCSLKESFVLHNSYVNLPKGFNLLAKSQGQNFPLLFKKKDKNIYGILFHPEVRDKKIIENFLNLL